MARIRVRVFAKERDAQAAALRKWFGDRAEFIQSEQWDEESVFECQPDILLLTHFYLYESVVCIDESRRRKIPTLFLQDGILEWRCQYENPLFGSGGGSPQHQPVLTDKIACIGNQSARQISAWGNESKVEVTGMPRLDELLARKSRPVAVPGKRLLVMTARKPWFDKEQEEKTLYSLLDLKEELEKMPGVEVLWRLTRGIEGRLGVQNLEGLTLPDLIDQSDAVITTPSTSAIEAMIMGRPVAFLDYFNVPPFVSTAWTISAREHIRNVVRELMNPPAAKMIFQRDQLQDILRMDKPACEVVGQLMLDMAEIGRRARETGERLVFPSAMSERPLVCRAPDALPLSKIYPNQEVFRIPDITDLQSRLARAERENRKLRTELEKRNFGYWLSAAGYAVYRYYKNLTRNIRIRR